jgi:hypothetical protein
MAWAPDYATSAELKAYTRIADSVDDTQVALALTASSRAIDRATGRQFGVVSPAEERVYTPFYDRHRRRWLVAIDDLATTTSLVVEVDGTAVTAYTLEPRNAVLKGKVWETLVFDTDSPTLPTGVEFEVAITALWGWSSVPSAVKQACLLQARRDSPFGVAGSPDLGNELRLLAKLDPDVSVSLSAYIRWWAAA